MTNLDLLNFNFVDRTSERTKFRDFFDNKLDVKILLVLGDKNVGKNYLIDRIIEQNESKTFLVIDFNDLKKPSAIYTLLEELDFIANGKFFKFIKDNYVDLLRITTGVISPIIKLSSATESELFSNMISANVVLNNIKQEQESTTKVICKYINKISKHEDLVIILKNFSKCDEYSINNFFNIISTSVEDEKTNVKYIISVEENDFNDNIKGVYSFFSYKVPMYPIILKRFDDPELFYEMLFDIFDFTPEDKNSLHHLFNICNGYPGELRNIISKIYMNNSRIINSRPGEAKWDSNLILRIINKNNLKVNIGDPISKLILLIVMFLEIDLSYDTLLAITRFVAQKMHMVINENNDAIENHLQQLIYDDKLITITNNSPEYVVLNQNIIKKPYYDEFVNDNISQLVSKYIYEYLIDNINGVPLDNKYYQQIAWHAFNANYPNWDRINLKVGVKFYEKSLISEAIKIFMRIRPYWRSLTLENKFVIIECFYEYGKYKEASELIETIDTTNCNFQQLLLIVKVYNINIEKAKAIMILDDMLIRFRTNYEQMMMLDMKQRILSNIEGKRINAKKIFDDLSIKLSNPNNHAEYYDFLLSSMEYYRGKVVQDNFDILENIYTRNENQLMLAELDVNRGFDFFWQGEITKAKNCFKSSIEVFERIRIHEISYALNNYANCLMMEGDFEGAISCIRRALMFNKSDYTEKTLKTHLMVCYALTNNTNYIRLFAELEKFIINNKHSKLDISLYLKITYALGFVQEFSNDFSNPVLNGNNKDYVSEALKIADSYDSETLPYVWFKDWRKDIEQDIKHRISDDYQDFYNYRFEPWLLTITHD